MKMGFFCNGIVAARLGVPPPLPGLTQVSSAVLAGVTIDMGVGRADLRGPS